MIPLIWVVSVPMAIVIVVSPKRWSIVLFNKVGLPL